MQNDDERTLAEKTISKPERTKKLEEQHLVKFCSDVARDNQHPEQAEANKILAERRKLQNLPTPSPKEQQAKATKLETLFKRMEKFRKENQ